jgi:hypothetical protein
VRALVDPGGRVYDVGQVHELRSLVAAVVGEREEAVEALAVAMTEYGRVRGRVLAELDGLDESGRAAAAALRRGLGVAVRPSVAPTAP